jgi:hypothetical protein
MAAQKIKTDVFSKDDYDKAFLPIFWAYVQQLKILKNSQIRKYIKQALGDALRKWTDGPVYMVSEEVMKLAKTRPIPIDPFTLSWRHRKIFNQDLKNKPAIVYEHTTPLGEAIETLLECKTEEAVVQFMKGYSGVCWITREEDNRLNKSGFRSKRKAGWEQCYTECGIKVVRLPALDS